MLLSPDHKAPSRPQWSPKLELQTCGTHGSSSHAQPLLLKYQHYPSISGSVETSLPIHGLPKPVIFCALLCPSLGLSSLIWIPSFLKIILYQGPGFYRPLVQPQISMTLSLREQKLGHSSISFLWASAANSQKVRQIVLNH